MANPYAGIPDYQLWSRSMTWQCPSHIDPVTHGVRVIAKGTKIATLGSCFAQHLAKELQGAGYNYLVTENAPRGLPEAEALDRQFGVFTARYGNVYTVRQALQLLKRAFGEFQPHETAWALADRYVDPFRPRVEPKGFASVVDLNIARAEHLAAVRRMFLEADVLIFTLGLTEAWASRIDGAIYPLAPGVFGGAFNRDKHEFVNFSVDGVRADLAEFVSRAQSINRKLTCILTISPVPLIATYEDRHVLVSTTISKSILRVAAEEVVKSCAGVLYFPSYEIITAPGLSERYFDGDLREVTRSGVDHVMRTFRRHYTAEGAEPVPFAGVAVPDNYAYQGGVICDEEAIELARARDGSAI